MTISTTESSIILACTGQNSFTFPFVGVATSDITVSSIISSGVVSPLSSSTYTVTLNAANPNQLWGVGGIVSFTSAPSTGTSLLIQRTLPYTQTTSVQNQGNYYAQVTEQALDTLCMEVQQIAARTTQFRGVWTTSTLYNFGDIVQDGVNGAGTNNYYICQNSNTSGVWATDLAAGDWTISVLAVVPTANQLITLSGAISGAGTSGITTGFNAGVVTNTAMASGAVSFSKMANFGPNTVLVNSSATSGTPGTIALSSGTLVGMGAAGNVAAITLGNTLSMTANTLSTVTPNFSQKQVVVATSAITGTTPLMEGLAGSFTPTSTGITFMQIKGWGQNGNSDSAVVQMNYGQGAAPSNSNASQGTPVGIAQTLPLWVAGNGQGGEFIIGGIATLSTGVTYWLDMTLKNVAGATSSTIQGADIIAYEIK